MNSGHGDPGLQPERTNAARTRTALALAADAILLAKVSPGPGHIAAVMAALCLIVSLVSLIYAPRQYDSCVREFATGVVTPAFVRNLVSAVLVGLLAITTAWSILTG